MRNVARLQKQRVAGPNEVKVKEGTYWGTMHVLMDGQVKYNEVATRSLAARFSLTSGQSI